MANSAIVGLLKVLLTADSAQFTTELKRTTTAAKAWQKDLGAIGRQASQLGSQLTTTLTLPIVAIGGAATKMAMDFESSFAGVRKTVNATEPEFEALERQFRDLAKAIPINVNEINRLGEAAGALGIPKERIAEFTRVMAMMGVTTNLTSDQAADSIARIQNIFGAAGQDTERLASAIVALGNAGASTETEIVEMAQRIAGAGHTVGLTQAQVVGLASALASVGIRAEMGGTTISRVFLKMQDAAKAGASASEEWGRVAGMTGAQFKALFDSDPSAALVAVVNGLGRMKDSGENVNATIEGLVGKSILMKDTLLRLTGAGELLNAQLAIGNQAWQDNSALSVEAGKRFETTASQLTLFWNRLKDVGITFGEALLPVLMAGVELLSKLTPLIEGLAHGFAAMPEPLQMAVVALGGLAAAAGPVLFVFGQLASAAGSIAGLFAANGLVTSALTAMGTSLPAVTAAVGSFGSALLALATGPIGIAVAAVGGLVAAWVFFGDEITAVVKAVYEAVKTWLLDNFGPVFESIGGLLVSLKDMFVAFGELVAAVFLKVVGYAADLFKGVKTWLLDKLQPVLTPLGKAIEAIATVFGIVKDKVVGFARALYEGVKTWLIDRFVGIVDGIKSKIDAVTGFFRNMHDAVVGHSYVPDMVRGIDREFARLGDIMVRPAKLATDRVVDTFRDMQQRIQGVFTDFGSTVQGWLSTIGGPIGGAFGSIVGQVLAGIGGLLTGGITSLINMGVQAISVGLQKIGQAIADFFSSTPIMEQLSNRATEAGFEGTNGLLNELVRIGRMDLVHAFNTLDNSKAGGFRAQDWMDEVRRALDLPSLGMGGVVMQPTLAMIGEAGPEAVVPLDGRHAFGGGAMTVIFEQDGRRAAEYQIRHIPGAVQRIRRWR